MRFLHFLAVVFGIVLYVSTAQASVIVSDVALYANDGFFTPNVQAVGQSVTTPVGGPWNSIKFNFYNTNYDGVTATLGSELAYGSLYVLNQTYTGLPSGLSTSTPGFLAATSTIQGGEWVFSPSVILQANTQYYFFTDTISTARVASMLDRYSGGTAIRTFPGPNYQVDTVHDAVFQLQGTAVPEPSSVLLVGMGVFAVGVLRWRKGKA